MKKIMCYILIIIMLLSASTVMAAENASFGIGLTSTKTSVNPGDEITVTAKVKDFKNMTEGLYAFLATIEYDKEVFETLTADSIKGLGTWSNPTFNPSNGLLTADSSSGVKEESEVFAITFKVKSTAQVGKSTQIVVKDFEASEGNYDIEANAPVTITINIVEKTTDNSNNSNNSNNNSSSSSSSNSSNSSSNKDNSSSDKKIPQTGEEDFIIIGAIAIVFVIMIFGYMGYKKYRGI